MTAAALQRGETGEAVRDLQRRLAALGFDAPPDEPGEFGPSTEAAVRAFQQQRGLVVDGLCGPQTWAALVESGFSLGDRTLYFRQPMLRGDDVTELQRQLNSLGFDAGREDGIFGAESGTAVLNFQRNIGMKADAIVGPDTVEALERIRPVQPGPSRALVREAEHLRAARASVVGSRIAIDPGHGPDDPGNVGPSGTSETEITLLLASDLADALARLGAIPSILRAADETPSPSDRARAANELDAVICISLHLNAGGPSEQGSTCSYFGAEDTYSPAGQRLAELIQDELTSRVGLVDGRTHRLTISLLRETRMPAVQVQPAFVTHPDEERLLNDPGSRARMAEAIALGIGAFFATPEAATDDVHASTT